MVNVKDFLKLMSVTGLRNASAPSPKQAASPGDGSNRSHAKSHDHIARIWPDRGVDCRSVADYCAYRLVCSAFQAVAGRGHDGIRDSHSGRDGGHRFIELEGPAATGITHPADTAG